MDAATAVALAIGGVIVLAMIVGNWSAIRAKLAAWRASGSQRQPIALPASRINRAKMFADLEAVASWCDTPESIKAINTILHEKFDRGQAIGPVAVTTPLVADPPGVAAK